MSDKIYVSIERAKLRTYSIIFILVALVIFGYVFASQRTGVKAVTKGVNTAAANTQPQDDMSSHHGGAKKKFETLTTGIVAPQFSLPSTSGKTISLVDYKGKNVLLFFNEGVMCAPCWQEISRLERFKNDFAKLNTVILPISVDDQKTWEPILQAEKITMPILIDSDKKITSVYKALGTPSSMHSDRAGHTYVHIDKNQNFHAANDFPAMNVQASILLSHLKSFPL